MQNTAAEEESLKSFRNPENQSSQSICNLMRDNSLLRKGILYYGHDDLRISRSAPLERRSKQKTAGRTRGRVHPCGSVVHHPIMDPMRDAPVERRRIEKESKTPPRLWKVVGGAAF